MMLSSLAGDAAVLSHEADLLLLSSAEVKNFQLHLYSKGKAVPLHAVEALGGRGGI
jgi:hypothetical protein